AERAWCVTPFNSSNIPSLVEMNGLPLLLGRQTPIHLTAPPLSKTIQSPVSPPGTVSLAQLKSRLVAQPLGSPFLDVDGVEVTPRTGTKPLDAVWCIAFDDAGSVQGKWRG